MSSSLFGQLFGLRYKAIEKSLYGRPTHNDLLDFCMGVGSNVFGYISLFLYQLLLVRGMRSFGDNRKTSLLIAQCVFLTIICDGRLYDIMNPAFVFVNMFL